MRIKEIIERECCEPRDLSPYHGMLKGTKPESFSFCRHCGELWIMRPGCLVSADGPRRLFDVFEIAPRFPRGTDTDD